MPLLPYISDDDLVKYTREVLNKAGMAEVEASNKLYSNVIDPFSAVFDSMRHNFTLDEWLVQEKSRQIQKTLQNAVGEFHQNILGSVEGWQNSGRGGSYDIINNNKKIIAEIKNKHNTMNSSSAEAVYSKLTNHLRFGEKGYIAYVVFIIPKNPKPLNTRWSPNKITMSLREDIRRIDGASFYELATGYNNALKMLYEALPKAVSMVINGSPDKIKSSRLYEDLISRAYS